MSAAVKRNSAFGADFDVCTVSSHGCGSACPGILLQAHAGLDTRTHMSSAGYGCCLGVWVSDPNSLHHCFLYLNQDSIPFKSAFHVLLSCMFKIHSQFYQNISLGKSEPGMSCLGISCLLTEASRHTWAPVPHGTASSRFGLRSHLDRS